MAKWKDYPSVPDYDMVPEADDLIKEVITSVQDEVLKPIAEAMTFNNERSDASPTLNQVFGLSHTKICKVINILNAYQQNIKEAQEIEHKENMLRASFDEPPF